MPPLCGAAPLPAANRGVETLHTDRDTVDARGDAGVDLVVIEMDDATFERDLAIRRERQAAPHGVEDDAPDHQPKVRSACRHRDTPLQWDDGGSLPRQPRARSRQLRERHRSSPPLRCRRCGRRHRTGNDWRRRERGYMRAAAAANRSPPAGAARLPRCRLQRAVACRATASPRVATRRHCRWRLDRRWRRSA